MAYVNVLDWKAEQVADWLRGLEDTVYPYAHFFLNNDVTGQVAAQHIISHVSFHAIVSIFLSIVTVVVIVCHKQCHTNTIIHYINNTKVYKIRSLLLTLPLQTPVIISCQYFARQQTRSIVFSDVEMDQISSDGQKFNPTFAIPHLDWSSSKFDIFLDFLQSASKCSIESESADQSRF